MICSQSARALLAALLATVAIGTAHAQTVLRASILTPKNSPQGEQMDVFGQELEKRTQGRYKVKTFYSAALGGEREAVEAVQLGTLDLTLGSGAISNFVPEVKVFDVPFLLRDHGHARRVLDGPIGQQMLAKFEARGFKALAWGENGFRHMTNSKHAIRGPEDLKGLKMRTMENPVHMRAYRAFGLSPTPMNFAEVFGALQQGVVDGQENPLSVIANAKFDQVQKYLTLTAHVYSPSVLLMGKPAFDKLSPSDKSAFIESAKIATAANRAKIDADEKVVVQELRARGMEVVDQVDRGKFEDALKPVYAEFEKEFGKATLTAIRETP
jgi:tripartite ATP-independent transporter DctP family solute receptor